MFKNNIVYGISSAAGWAWGVSFLVTYTLIQEKGIFPFLIWATFNTLAVPFFGLAYTKVKEFQYLLKTQKILIYFMGLIQFFSIIINLQAIFQMGTLVGMQKTNATILALVVGVLFIIIALFNEYKTVLYSTVLPWIIILLLILLLIILGYYNEQYVKLLYIKDNKFIYWAFYAGFLLLCSPFVDLQCWVRAEKINKNSSYKSYIYSGIFFGIYMLLILVLSYFKINYSMSIILITLVIMISCSTIQPNAHALKEKFKIGWFLSLSACIFWPLLRSFGIINLWTTIATFRAVVVIIMFILIAFKRKKNEVRK